MADATLTGSRIRERRLLRGVRQSHLAKAVEVSPSYLNLIEHNRRRIGGKLLLDIAAALDIEPSLLTDGAEATLIARLREAAGDVPEAGAEHQQSGEFAGRFPGWARLVEAQHRRIGQLERAVETLTDRLAHDPHLADTLHEVLSTVTAIRSTAAILVETREIEPEWRDRFHRNINEDAQRLADGAQALVDYLDGASDSGAELSAPQEELEAFVAQQGYHFAALEAAEDLAQAEIAEATTALRSAVARAQGQAMLERYAADARVMPLAEVEACIGAHGADPLAVAAQFGVDPAAAMRRIASLPGLDSGLVIADGSGTILLRKPIEGFALPLFGAGCPILPLYRALSRPMVPMHERVSQPARGDGDGGERVFETWAMAQPAAYSGANRDPLYQVHLLLLPMEGQADDGDIVRVGTGCRVCPRRECAARREPSIMADGF